MPISAFVLASSSAAWGVLFVIAIAVPSVLSFVIYGGHFQRKAAFIMSSFVLIMLVGSFILK